MNDATKLTDSHHAKHCFVVMPSGRDPADQKWFRGWYEVVIRPAILEAGYEPVLAAAEEQPGAINDEIRTHLATDPMVVVDLGGTEPEEEPNPNVMYELGIRHALGLPLVMMAWKGQRLPFDVGNQRAIMEGRDLVDLELNRRKLIAFVHAAEQGRYYRPMDAVARQTAIQTASESLAEDSLLRALASEVRDLRIVVASAPHFRSTDLPDDGPLTIKKAIRSRIFRKQLHPLYLAAGGDPNKWEHLLQTHVPLESAETFMKYRFEDWREYIERRAADFQIVPGALNEELLERVRNTLPPQPWPRGTHLQLADTLQIPPSMVSNCIDELIRRKAILKQVNGEVLPSTVEVPAPEGPDGAYLAGRSADPVLPP